MQRSTPYPEWIFGDVERMVPRRAGKAPVGEDGKREYRVATCVHGCGGKVIVNAATFSENRRKSIEDHLGTCPCVADADRPAKKLRALAVCQVTDPAKCKTIVPLVHAKCERRISDLEQAQEQTNARLDALEAKSTLYDGALKAVMPLIELPLVQGRAEQQLRVALPAPTVATVTRSAPPAVVPVTLDINSMELANRALNNMYQETTIS